MQFSNIKKDWVQVSPLRIASNFESLPELTCKLKQINACSLNQLCLVESSSNLNTKQCSQFSKYIIYFDLQMNQQVHRAMNCFSQIFLNSNEYMYLRKALIALATFLCKVSLVIWRMVLIFSFQLKH